jgi:hypothetical protein
MLVEGSGAAFKAGIALRDELDEFVEPDALRAGNGVVVT